MFYTKYVYAHDPADHERSVSVPFTSYLPLHVSLVKGFPSASFPESLHEPAVQFPLAPLAIGLT